MKIESEEIRSSGDRSANPLVSARVLEKRNSRFATWRLRLFSSGGHLMSETHNSDGSDNDKKRGDNKNNDTADNIIEKIKSSACNTLLTDEEFAILYMRFGISSGKAVTHAVIADVLGKTAEYIVQTERSALKKMSQHYLD